MFGSVIRCICCAACAEAIDGYNRYYGPAAACRNLGRPLGGPAYLREERARSVLCPRLQCRSGSALPDRPLATPWSGPLIGGLRTRLHRAAAETSGTNAVRISQTRLHPRKVGAGRRGAHTYAWVDGQSQLRDSQVEGGVRSRSEKRSDSFQIAAGMADPGA